MKGIGGGESDRGDPRTPGDIRLRLHGILFLPHKLIGKFPPGVAGDSSAWIGKGVFDSISLSQCCTVNNNITPSGRCLVQRFSLAPVPHQGAWVEPEPLCFICLAAHAHSGFHTGSLVTLGDISLAQPLAAGGIREVGSGRNSLCPTHLSASHIE